MVYKCIIKGFLPTIFDDSLSIQIGGLKKGRSYFIQYKRIPLSYGGVPFEIFGDKGIKSRSDKEEASYTEASSLCTYEIFERIMINILRAYRS